MVRLSIRLDAQVPVGNTVFPPWYLDLLGDLTRLPLPRIPDTPVLALVKMLAERRRRASLPATPVILASSGRPA